MCHRTKKGRCSNEYNGYGYGDGDVPEADTKPYKNVNRCRNLPENGAPAPVGNKPPQRKKAGMPLIWHPG